MDGRTDGRAGGRAGQDKGWREGRARARAVQSWRGRGRRTGGVVEEDRPDVRAVLPLRFFFILGLAGPTPQRSKSRWGRFRFGTGLRCCLPASLTRRPDTQPASEPAKKRQSALQAASEAEPSQEQEQEEEEEEEEDKYDVMAMEEAQREEEEDEDGEEEEEEKGTGRRWLESSVRADGGNTCPNCGFTEEEEKGTGRRWLESSVRADGGNTCPNCGFTRPRGDGGGGVLFRQTGSSSTRSGMARLVVDLSGWDEIGLRECGVELISDSRCKSPVRWLTGIAYGLVVAA
ncbi:hypothetical protein AXG93_1864s1010 [Marchantia polymorpha subsp. ruderalis]|uniref:Uncharacterized protein n=1 Tax=Marchantia polymorpha subsp. ruderalis TaxID=1480154 RepID=A0A176WQ79_MARPO|nr:hypothetical protein AXG93_1864s1010 [Marchantia polymorpha subsp. ruderalis]